MKKIIWIDVGTHFAQEHSSIFGSSFSFYLFVFKRFISGGLLKRGRFVSYSELMKIFKARAKIRKRKEKFFSIFVEANKEIVQKKKFYPKADLLFNIALTEDDSRPAVITKLYFGKGNIFGEGSSLFKNKYESIDQDYMTTLGISSETFFQELGEFLDSRFGDYDVLLRLNCEGVEDNVIYSAHKYFTNKLKLICGSLKDVEELKGLDAADRLNLYLKDNQLPFVSFSSGIYSWHIAHTTISNLLERDI